jgi:negative regulator of flagellin synthesis FlgM
MTIERIGLVDPIQPGKKPGQTGQVKGAPNADIITISSEGQAKSELLRIQELVAAAPESRAEKIAELKIKINDPSYINDKVVNATADNIIDALFG